MYSLDVNRSTSFACLLPNQALLSSCCSAFVCLGGPFLGLKSPEPLHWPCEQGVCLLCYNALGPVLPLVFYSIIQTLNWIVGSKFASNKNEIFIVKFVFISHSLNFIFKGDFEYIVNKYSEVFVSK